MYVVLLLQNLNYNHILFFEIIFDYLKVKLNYTKMLYLYYTIKYIVI